MTEGPLFPPEPSGGPIGANPSFFDLVRRSRPESLPSTPGTSDVATPHGTTVVALKFDSGVVFGGDRRATEGFSIADETMEKVFAADDFSVIAIAGAAGQAIEIVKLFQLELEHYEMIRGNLPMAIQGLVVVPLFGGFDERRDEGRIFYYDATGGRWEEDDFHATGSGGRPAKSSLKKRWRPGLDRTEALQVAMEALVDASQEDAATGGPDPTRGIFPTVVVVTSTGAESVESDELRAAHQRVVGGGGDGA
jgi:proteasome beta subunit